MQPKLTKSESAFYQVISVHTLSFEKHCSRIPRDSAKVATWHYWVGLLPGVLGKVTEGDITRCGFWHVSLNGRSYLSGFTRTRSSFRGCKKFMCHLYFANPSLLNTDYQPSSWILLEFLRQWHSEPAQASFFCLMASPASELKKHWVGKREDWTPSWWLGEPKIHSAITVNFLWVTYYF